MFDPQVFVGQQDLSGDGMAGCACGCGCSGGAGSGTGAGSDNQF